MNLIQLETENYTIAKQNIDIAFDRFKVGIATSYELREVQRNAVAAETRDAVSQIHDRFHQQS